MGGAVGIEPGHETRYAATCPGIIDPFSRIAALKALLAGFHRQ
jgi:hypothetical protein